MLTEDELDPPNVRSRVHLFDAGLLPRHIEVVTFFWSNEHGRCTDCGLPAAFLIPYRYGSGKPDRLCAVCAANAAADGARVERLFSDD